jgi:hypothetical protein
MTNPSICIFLPSSKDSFSSNTIQQWFNKNICEIFQITFWIKFELNFFLFLKFLYSAIPLLWVNLSLDCI